jgi:Cyclic nucleotide-binding domain/Major Facilitator Superfamily
MDVLLVIIALDLLNLPPSAAGYLTAARGAGGLVGGLWSMGLVGKRHLATPLGGSQLVYGTSAAGLALSSIPLLTGALVMAASAGYTRADTAGRILLERVVPDPILTRVVGVLEGLSQAGMAAGATVAPFLVAVFGIRAGVLVAVLALPAAVALLWTRIRAVDRAAEMPERELELIHSLDLFASLPLPTLENLASRFVPVTVAPGEALIREGDAGDRFYVIEDGEVAVSLNGRPVATLGPGKYFGEIALLHDTPRNATVTAVTSATSPQPQGGRGHRTASPGRGREELNLGRVTSPGCTTDSPTGRMSSTKRPTPFGSPRLARRSPRTIPAGGGAGWHL